MSEKFTNIHRYFVQFMLTNSLVTLNQGLSFLERVDPENEHSLTNLKTLVTEINREIGNQSFKIASTTCEVTGNKVLVWLSTKNDEISRLQAGFSAVDLEYFHAIMQEIVSSDDHIIKYPRCINISSTLTAHMTREHGEQMLTKWIDKGYFVKREANVYLGPRTIQEFTTYLRTHTENCICGLCSELVFVGKTCSSCTKPFHSFCIDKYLQNQTKCPSCKRPWSCNMETEDSETGSSQSD